MAVASTLVVAGLSAAPTASAGPEFYANGVNVGSRHQLFMADGPIVLQSEEVGKVHCTALIRGTVSNTGGAGVGEISSFSPTGCEAPELEELLCHFYPPPFEESPCGKGHPVYLDGEMPFRVRVREGEVCKEASKRPSECEAESEREQLTVYSGFARRTSLPWTLQLLEGIRLEEEVSLLRLGGALSCYPKETIVVEGKEVEEPVNWEQVPSGCVKLNFIVPRLPAEIQYYGRLELTLLNGTKNGLSPSRLQFAESGALQDGKVSEEGHVSAYPTDRATISGTVHLLGEPNVELLTAR
jgi:hypothetical protein